MNIPRVTNMVISTTLSENINISAFVNLVALIPLNKEITMEKLKNKIPYFGIDGAIISIRHDNSCRGLRGKNKIGAFADMDLQCMNKNIHIKISQNKFNAMGILSVEMAERAFDYTLKHIEMTERNWERIRKIPNEIKISTIRWVWENQQDLKNPPEDIDPFMVTMISLQLHETPTKEIYFDRMSKVLMNLTPIYERRPVHSNIIIHNSVLVYNIGGPVSLIETAQKLHAHKCYGVKFHNWESKRVQVVLPIKPVDDIDNISFDENTPRSDDSTPKIEAHKFIIRPSGAVTQMSPCSYEESYAACQKLCDDLKLTQ